jgi:RNA polymerase sigma factor (sigma-70 family)
MWIKQSLSDQYDVEEVQRDSGVKNMAAASLDRFLHHLRRAVQPGADVGTDPQLLECFLRQGDEAAFEVLVRRHGPMVFGVCRRVLTNLHDAEDAFQATFLVLVRKAASLRARETVANWLYGVAYRTALEARRANARRRAREEAVRACLESISARADDDWREVLDEALSGLPGKYREVVVLCDLEGKGRRDVAQELGCPEGTVASRLARARALLASRLTKRGVTLSTAALAALLTQEAASADLSPLLISGTVTAASVTAAGPTAATAVLSVGVVALTEGVLHTMLLAKLRIGATAVLILLMVSGAISLFCYSLQAADPGTAQKASQPPLDQGAVDPAALRKAQLVFARKAFGGIWSHYQVGLSDEEAVYRWSVRWLEAERALAVKKADHIAAFTAHWNRMKELAKLAPERAIVVPAGNMFNGKIQHGLLFKDGKQLTMVAELNTRPASLTEITGFYRTEAELWLAQAKEKKTP